jgi:hypothetical protein
MDRKTKKLKKIKTDDPVDRVDLTESIEPIKSDAQVQPLKAVQSVGAVESVESVESLESGVPAAAVEAVELIKLTSSADESDALIEADGARKPAKPAMPSVSDEAVEDHAAAEFKAKTTLAQDAFRKTFDFVKDQKVLVDAFLVAVSFHVVMFPVLWTAGWALPWPKPPVVTTLIDYDLQEWIKTRKPKNIIEFRDPALNQ